MLTQTLCAAALLAPAGAACAALINPGIENNSTPIFGRIDGWGPNGGWADHAGFARPNNAALGSSFGFYSVNNQETVGQILPFVYLPNTGYSFTSWGQGGGDNMGVIPYELGYDDGMGNFVLLAHEEYFVGETWQLLPGVSHTTTDVGDEIGRAVWVRLGLNTQGIVADDVWFDNFTFVPAPGAVALLAVGGLVFLRRRR